MIISKMDFFISEKIYEIADRLLSGETVNTGKVKFDRNYLYCLDDNNELTILLDEILFSKDLEERNSAIYSANICLERIAKEFASRIVKDVINYEENNEFYTDES